MPVIAWLMHDVARFKLRREKFISFSESGSSESGKTYSGPSQQGWAGERHRPGRGVVDIRRHDSPRSQGACGARSLPKGLGRSGIKLLLIGGSVNLELGASLGGRAMREFARIRPDLLVLGVCSIHAKEGLGAFDAEDAEMKRTLIQRAGSVAVAVLNEKLESVAAHRVSEIDSIADVVVEADAPADTMMALAERGLRIHKAALRTY
jgi:hypothetical protein